MQIRQPLTREQVRDVIEFRGCDHVPVVYHLWCRKREDGCQDTQPKRME